MIPYHYSNIIQKKLKKLLAEAGYPDGIEITTIETEGDPFVDIYLVLQEQLKKRQI